MKRTIHKAIRRTEFYLCLAIFALAILIQARSGQFFTFNNIIDLTRALIIPAMFCICEMMVLISGGTDVSFPAIASLSMFIVSTRMANFEGNIFLFLLVGALLGLVMGALNGFLVGYYKFPTLIVTLGTSSLFYGILYGPFKAQEYPIPGPMLELGKAKLFTVSNSLSGLKSDLPVVFLFFVALLIIAWYIMRHTLTGRGIYAIGGNPVSAKRSGFNLFKIQMFIYCFSGLISGLVGVLRASMLQNCNPTNLNGMEMTAIAACVLGGVSVMGGKGTLLGMILGITLMTIMQNSLVLLGVPTNAQKIFTGLLILIGTGVTSYRQLRSAEKPHVMVKEAA